MTIIIKQTWPYFGGMKEKKEKKLQTIQERFIPTPSPKACSQIDKALLACFPYCINYMGVNRNLQSYQEI